MLYIMLEGIEMSYSVRQLVSEIESALLNKTHSVQIIWSLGPLLQRLVLEGGDLTIQGDPRNGSSGLEGRLLYDDPRGKFKVVVSRFVPNVPTPIHSHVSWGVICGISGKERYTSWTLTDNQRNHENSNIKIISAHHIERGDIGYWYKSPNNIHRQWAEGHEPSCVAIIMGEDGSRVNIFDTPNA